MCLDLLTEQVYETIFTVPLRLSEFSERQESSIMHFEGRLGMWVNTIRTKITKCLQQATVKWYHLNETSLENYHASRLRAMLVFCRLMMSNALLLLGESNLNAYVIALEKMTPCKVDMPAGAQIL